MSLLPRLLGAITLLACAHAYADYPERPVRLLVPNTPGGPIDITMRLVANKLGEKWGQTVVVENVPGASGQIAGRNLARAEPDGYTLGTMIASTMTIVPFAVDKMLFDAEKDLAPVSLLARTPFVYVVAADSPISSWSEFVTAARARDLSLGSYSIGTAFHLVWEETARRTGIQALYVPSSSAMKTQTDLVSHQLDIALEAPSSAKGMLDQGRLRALAVTSPERLPTLPDVPTLAEAGVTGYVSTPWFSVMAPAGTPQDIINKVQQDLAEVLQSEDMRQRMANLGQIPVASDPQTLADTIRQDREAMEPLVKELGIRLQ